MALLALGTEFPHPQERTGLATMATAKVTVGHIERIERMRTCPDCGGRVPARQIGPRGVCRACHRDLVVARKGFVAIARKGYPTAAGHPQGGW